MSLLVGQKRDALAFDLYSDWTWLGRVAMKGKLGEKLERLREDVKRALQGQQEAGQQW